MPLLRLTSFWTCKSTYLQYKFAIHGLIEAISRISSTCAWLPTLSLILCLQPLTSQFSTPSSTPAQPITSRHRPIATNTRHPHPALDPITKHNPLRPRRSRHQDIPQHDIITNRIWTTHQTGNLIPVLPTAAPPEVQKEHVRDVDLARVRLALGSVDVEVALVEHNRPVGVADDEVLERDVADEAVADGRAGPGFQAGAVLGRSAQTMKWH